MRIDTKINFNKEVIYLLIWGGFGGGGFDRKRNDGFGRSERSDNNRFDNNRSDNNRSGQFNHYGDRNNRSYDNH